MNNWYSAAEIAGLPGLPGTKRGIQLRAKRESWLFRPRAGRGGGREYSETCLTPAALAALNLRRIDAALTVYDATVAAWLAAVKEGRLLVGRDALTAELGRLEQYRDVASRHIRDLSRLLGEGNGDE